MRKEFATKAARMLGAMANEKRLIILSALSEVDELSVKAIAAVAGLKQSATSQHLSKLRSEKLVRTRRDAQTVFYSLNSAGAERVLKIALDSPLA